MSDRNLRPPVRKWPHKKIKKIDPAGHPDEPATEPRAPAVIALLTIGALSLTMPAPVAVGSRWLPLVVVCLLVAPMVLTRHKRLHLINHAIGIAGTGAVTLFMVLSLSRALSVEVHHLVGPASMLRLTITLWLMNVLVFASWYWRLDAGGPHVRATFYGHRKGAFLFPQMTLSDEQRLIQGLTNWSPGFIDYLFLAFNTSTAFSPTDSAVLSPWAKVLMMLQSAISLSIVAVLAARAVNIL